MMSSELSPELSSELVHSATERISLAFDVDHLANDLPQVDSRNVLHERLVRVLIELLTNQPERLMAILYRIDVSEEAVNRIFSTLLPPDVPDALAELIINRQIQKAETRQRYRS